jgi:hypothetical protein
MPRARVNEPASSGVLPSMHQQRQGKHANETARNRGFMPISVAHLKKNTRTVDIDYFGDRVRVTYKPSEITPTVMAEMSERAEEGDQLFTPQILSRTLIQWDLAEDEEDLSKTYPLTFEAIKELDSAFLAHILTGITEDMFPKKRNGRR